jgi:hypothetical protein
MDDFFLHFVCFSTCLNTIVLLLKRTVHLSAPSVEMVDEQIDRLDGRGCAPPPTAQMISAALEFWPPRTKEDTYTVTSNDTHAILHKRLTQYESMVICTYSVVIARSWLGTYIDYSNEYEIKNPTPDRLYLPLVIGKMGNKEPCVVCNHIGVRRISLLP